MTKSDFRKLTAAPVILDGAFGTELIKRGMPEGVCPELWALKNPEITVAILQEYQRSGSQIVYIPSFGANAKKLAAYGLQDQVFELNRALAELAKKAVPQCFAFGDLAPTGEFVEPYGDLDFESTVEIYREQSSALLAGGADGIVIETMMDLQEARAALLGAKANPGDFPVIVTMTFDASGRSLTGVDPVSALVTLQALGADAFGCNCSSGPEEMAKILEKLKPYAQIPLIAKPNAGLPKFQDGKTVFSMDAKNFSTFGKMLFDAGAALLGGCCGTTPEHIKALKESLKDAGAPFVNSDPIRAVVASPSRYRVLDANTPFSVIGERINPTGKKALQAELREGKTDMVFDFAIQQTQSGAALLDVNMGMAGISEKDMMHKSLKRIIRATDLPLCIDTTDPETLEAALRLYPGRALYNSVSAEKERLEKNLPVAAKYGAMLILLPLTDEGIPSSLDERIQIVEKLLAEVKKYGYDESEVCIDALIMTVSANPEAAQLSLDLIAWAKKHHLKTVCGLSNVSFGLPERRLLNQTFLGMALGCGLNIAIANPLFPEIMAATLAADALNGRDVRQKNFIAKFSGNSAPAMPAAAVLPPKEKIRHALLDGNKEGIVPAIEAALKEQIGAMEIIDDILIPAITEVGEKYEKKEYFLPQLIASAEAMQTGTKFLEPLLVKSEIQRSKGKIVFATVKGDIHDIGKNIVIVVLRNYGFEVIDLGKDVPPEVIIDTAVHENIKVVALSALMTTTMKSMRETIELARRRGLDDLQFIIGGAVVDKEFADSIGAYYAADPMATMRCATRLFENQ